MENRSFAQMTALVLGAVYLLVGILGLIPVFGGSYTQTANNLLGFVPINLLHNLVHLLIGVTGLLSFSVASRARVFNQVFGVVLLLLGVAGVFISNPLGLVPIGGFDIVIHLVTGALLAYAGFASPAPARIRTA
jgi:hypothetical protein